MNRLPLPAAATVVVIAITIATCLAASAHGQTSSVQATLSEGEDSDWIKESDSKFQCANGTVLVGRSHEGSEEGNTRYRCASVFVRDRKVLLQNKETTKNFPEGEVGGNGRHSYVAPITRLWFGREHDGDENGNTRYNIAQPETGEGEILIQRFAGGWHSFTAEDDHKFQCPGANEVMIGRYHNGDEKGPSGYLCATLWTTPPPIGTAGVISLRNTGTNQPCTIDVPKFAGGITAYALTLYNDAAVCPDNVHGAFDLTNVESSVRMLMTDDPLCRKDKGNWWVELRTIQDRVTTNLQHGVRFPEILLTEPGRVVTPGLLLLGRHRKEGDTSDLTKSLSCVQLTTSPSPPPSPAANAPR